ncbi:MAG: quinolinate synthase NadA [Candidatus Krumholzibacteriota bacterium]|nr:quinolinate synthase NadA [Candidatus Krumholzibacteriota bacterium]
MPKSELVERIRHLKEEKGAVILAHNYQLPEIQDIADHLGDSLALSRLATTLPQEIILFCGVFFMAETAAILSPRKRVILPDPTAGCPMADMITAEALARLQEKHPGAYTVMYVNSTAEVKALADCCCTSANGVEMVAAAPADREIIFAPDKYLGGWIATRTGREMILWNGFCPSHQKFVPEEIRGLRRKYPGAVVMSHPEVNPGIAAESDVILGTGGMIDFAGKDPAGTFIVGTEVGMVYRLQKLYPGKRFLPASPRALCPNMKKITLEKVLTALESLEPVIRVAPDTARAARAAIERMLKTGRAEKNS